MNETTPPPGTPGGPGTPGAGPAGTPGGRPFAAGFFDWIRGLRVQRSDDRWFAGVASGIAARFGIDPLIVRGVFVVLALLGGPGILLYLAGWLLLPDTLGRIHLEEVFRGRASAGMLTVTIILATLVFIPVVIGLLVPSVAGVPNLGLWHWDLWGALGIPEWLSGTIAWLCWVAIIVLGVVWLSRAFGGQRHPAAPGQPSQPGDPAQPGAAGAPGAPRAQQDPAASFGQQTRDFADRAEAWGQRTGERAEAWGQQFSERANAWGERAGRRADEWTADVNARSAAWTAQHRAEQRATRLGPVHTVLTLALALLAAGATALWAQQTQALGASHIPGDTAGAVLASMIAALVVLALSLVVAGIRGRRTGWIGFLSACGVVAVLFAAVLPWGSRFQPFGHLDAGAEAPATVMLAGTTVLDLGSLDSRQAGEDYEVWVLAGNAKVQPPADRPARVRVEVGAGNITEQRDGIDFKQSGPLVARTIETGAGEPGPTTRVTVRVLGGNVTVVDPATSNQGGTR